MPITPALWDVSQYANVRADGTGTVDAKRLVQNDAQMVKWLDQAKRPVAAWYKGPDVAPTASGLAITDSITTLDLGTWRIPAPGNMQGQIIVAVCVDQYVGGSATLTANRPGLSPFTKTINAAGWSTLSVDVSGNNAYLQPTDLSLTLSGVTKGAGFRIVALSVFSSDAQLGSYPTSWPKLSKRLIAGNTSDDNHLVQQENLRCVFLAWEYQRTLAAHSFENPTSPTAPATGINNYATYRYLLRICPRTLTLAIWVRALVSSTPQSGKNAVTFWLGGVQQTVTYNGSPFSEIDLTNTTAAWFMVLLPIPATTPAPPVQQELDLEIRTQGAPVTDPNPPWTTITVTDISIYECTTDSASPPNVLPQYTASEILVLDPSSPNTRVDAPPIGGLPALPPNGNPSPILATDASGRQERHGWALYKEHLALYRVQHHVLDRIKPISTSNLATQSVPDDNTITIKWRPTRGATGFVIRVHLTRTGLTSPNVIGAFYTVDGGFSETVLLPESSGDGTGAGLWFSAPHWSSSLYDGQEHDIGLQVGFVRPTDRTWGASGGSDSVALDGVVITETGGGDSDGYFYRTATPNSTIPAAVQQGIVVDGTLTYTWTAKARYSHVRVLYQISGLPAANVQVTLQDPNGNTVTLKAFADSFPSAGQWCSDDVIGDAAPHAALSNGTVGVFGTDYSGGTGTWTLSIANGDVGVSGTLTNVGLELS